MQRRLDEPTKPVKMEEPVDEELEDPDPSADDAAGEAVTPPADGDDAAAGDESGTQPVTPEPKPTP